MANKKFRAQRSRQLIQIGGLFDKAGLCALLGVPSTMDLQTDGSEAANLAATILGLCAEQAERLDTENRDELLAEWRIRGKSLFREAKDDIH